MIGRLAAVAAMAALALGAATTGAMTATASAATQRASLTDIQNDVMCVSCHEPLAVSQSPQGDAERNFIRGLIAQGMTKSQIINALVQQYGTAVLGRPPASGFNLTVYIVPPAIVVIGLAVLAVTLPRWRRRTRSAAAQPAAVGPRLSPSETRRLDEELRRFGG